MTGDYLIEPEPTTTSEKLRAIRRKLEALPIPATEEVDHPAHYTIGGVEAITVIDAWGLGFCLGNTLKYLARAGRKGDSLTDLRKARWYIDHQIELLEQARA